MREAPRRQTILLAASLLVLFVCLAWAVTAGRTLELDEAVSRWVRSHRSPFLDDAMFVLSALGTHLAVACVGAAVALWARRRGARQFALHMMVVVPSAMILNTVLKNVVRRARPDIFADAVLPETYSFPSGHALVSFATYGAAAFVLGRLHPATRTPLYAVAAALVFMIGLSRIYLGVHWFTDVSAGFLVGATILAVARAVHEKDI